MESKKDIGKLFRENLEQLDFTPSTKVWEQIELDLEKKKKKRRFFIWFFFATLVIGGLLIGVGYTTSGYDFFTNKGSNATSDSDLKTNKGTTTTSGNEANSESTDSANTDVNAESANSSNADASQNSTTNVNTISDKEKMDSGYYLKKNNGKNKLQQKSGLANTSFKTKKGSKYKKNNAVASNRSSKKDRKNSNKSIAATVKTDSAFQPYSSSDPTQINTLETIQKATTVDSLIASTNNKKTNKKPRKEKDSLAVKDSVAEVEKPKEYEIIVAPYYSMNYSGYFGEFDALSNSQITENKGAMQSSYGVLLRWMFGGKAGLQVGAGKINNLYYSTIEKNSDVFVNTQNVALAIPASELNGIFANETKVKFTYESSFIEVPLEAYYVIRDKKIGVASSIGISMLFGGKNTVFAESDNISKMQIGKLTTNLPTSATANARLYLFYKITPALHLDVYPSFQYQIMGNKDKGDYSGYFFSIRTGLSYKF